MAENDFSQSLSDTLSRLMESPEIAGIVSSLQGSERSTEQNAENGGHEQPSAGINIPPDIMEKLPSMIAALSEMGIGSGGKETESPKPSGEKRKAGDKQRKALLSSLRPYLNPHRQSIIDNMLRIEGLAGILSTALPASGSTDTERR